MFSNKVILILQIVFDKVSSAKTICLSGNICYQRRSLCEGNQFSRGIDFALLIHETTRFAYYSVCVFDNICIVVQQRKRLACGQAVWRHASLSRIFTRRFHFSGVRKAIRCHPRESPKIHAGMLFRYPRDDDDDTSRTRVRLTARTTTDR